MKNIKQIIKYLIKYSFVAPILIVFSSAFAQYDYGYTDYDYDYGYIDYDYDYGYTDYDYDYGYTDYDYDYGYIDYDYDYSYTDYDYECYNCDVSDDLEVSCKASATNIKEGDLVTFTAEVSGGNSPFDYDWYGDVNGNRDSITARFNNEGSYYTTITVTDDDGNKASDTCYVEVDEEDDDDLEVSCKASPRNPEEGERVRFTAEVEGGNSPFDYDWSRDVNGDDRIVYERFNNEGDYEAKITVTDDDGNKASDTCYVEVDEEDDNNIAITSNTGLSNPNPGLPVVSSVYLSQVPYTGPGDTLALVLLSITGMLLSIVVVSKFRKELYRKQVQSRIAQFKEENKKIA